MESWVFWEKLSLEVVARLGGFMKNKPCDFCGLPIPSINERYCSRECANLGCSIEFSGEGNHFYGKKHKKSSIKKMKKAHKGFKHSKETIELYREQRKGENNAFYGKHHTPESIEKMSGPRPSIAGKNHPMYGKHLPPKTIENLSNSIKRYFQEHPECKLCGVNHPMFGRTGKLNPMYGVRGKDASMYGIRGVNHPRWNGGYDAYMKRRRNLGYIPMNSWFEGSEGHHIDDEFVIYIPGETHKSNSHNQNNKKSMKVINDLAFEFLAEQNLNNIF